MNAVIKEIYSVYSTTDEYGRRGSISGIFTTRSKADQEAIGIGWWGGTGSVIPGHVIIIDGVSYLLSSPTPVELDMTSAEAKAAKEKVKNAALAKLTSDERKALGV